MFLAQILLVLHLEGRGFSALPSEEAVKAPEREGNNINGTFQKTEDSLNQN